MSSAASPAGCFLVHHTNATSTAYYNSLAAGAECGGGHLLGGGLALSASQVREHSVFIVCVLPAVQCVACHRTVQCSVQ